MLGAALAPHASAQVVRVYNGASGTPNVFDTAGNYVGGVLPSVANGDTALFNGTYAGNLVLTYAGGFAGASPQPGVMLSLASTQTGSVSIDSGATTTALRMGNVTVASGAGALTLGDGANMFNIRLGGGAQTTTLYTNNSANTATVNSDVVFLLGANSDHGLSAGGTGNWVFKDVIDNNGGGSATGSGTLGFIKTGTGNVTLNGSNVFTGGTSVNGGTLTIGTGGGLYTSGTMAGAIVVNNGGTLQFARNDSLGASTVAAIPVILTVNGGTLTTTGFFTSLSNSILNGGTLIDNGGASAGFNAYRLSGVVQVGGNTASNINIGTTSAVNGINLGTNGANDSTTFSVADATGDATSDLNVNDIVRNTGTGLNGLIKAGLGTMTLSAANLYTGATTVNAGTLALTGSVASPALILGGGTLAYAPTVAASTQGFANGTTLNAGGSTVTATAGNTLSLGAITHAAGGLVNFGTTGTITTTTAATNGILGPYAFTGMGAGLSYATAGTVTAFTGGTSAGTAAGVTDTTGTANYNVAAGGTIATGTSANTLRYTGGTDAITGPVTLNGLMNAGTGALTVNGAVTIGAAAELDVVSNSQNTSITGAIGDNAAGASALAYGGAAAGILTLSGTNTYTGGTTIGGGTVNVASTGALGTTGAITMGGGTLQYSATNTTDYSNRFATTGGQAYNIDTNGQAVTFATALTSSAGTMNKLGAGTLTLTAVNTFVGGTTVNAGTLVIGVGGAAGALRGVVTVNPGATLNLGAGDALGYTVGTQITTLNVNGGTVNATATTGTVNEGFTTNLNLTGGTVTSAGATVNLRFNNQAVGSYNITSNASPTTSTITSNIDAFDGTLGIAVASGSTPSGVDLAMTGVIFDTGITKTGAGQLSLTGASTYTGATVVNGGTLRLDNNNLTTPRLAGTSNIAVNAGGTLLLAQSGATVSTDRINNAAAVTLGASATANGGGILNTGGLNEGPAGGATGAAAAVGALTLGNNSTINFSTGATAAGSNLLFASLTYTAGDVVSIRNFTGAIGTDTGAAGNDRLLFIADPGLTNAQLASISFYNDSGALLGSGATEFTYNGYLELVPSAVPEPATWLAGGLLVGLVGMRRRRQIAGWLRQAFV